MSGSASPWTVYYQAPLSMRFVASQSTKPVKMFTEHYWDWLLSFKYGLSYIVFSQNSYVGLPRWFSGKEAACQRRRHRFDPWVGKISCRGKRHPTPVFLPGKSHGRAAWWTIVHGVAELDTIERLSMHAHVPPKFICWSGNLEYVRMWWYLEIGSLKR